MPRDIFRELYVLKIITFKELSECMAKFMEYEIYRTEIHVLSQFGPVEII